MPMTRKGGILGPAPVPFWLKPARTFGLLSLTMFLRWVDRGRGPLLAFSPGPPPNRT